MNVTDLLKAANLLDSTDSLEAKLAADVIDYVFDKVGDEEVEFKSIDKLVNAMAGIMKFLENDTPEAKQLFEANPELYNALDKAYAYVSKTYNMADKDEKSLSTEMLSPDNREAKAPEFAPREDEPDLSKKESARLDVSKEKWESKEPEYIKASKIYTELAKAATVLDSKGHIEAANILDSILKDAAPVLVPDYPRRSETRGMYDSVANNKDSLRGQLVEEVLMNDESHLATHRGKSKTLSTRYDPDMPGVTMIRVSDGVYQSPVTRKVYDFNTGWQGESESYPGGSVKNQTPSFSQYSNSTRMFEHRNERMHRR